MSGKVGADDLVQAGTDPATLPRVELPAWRCDRYGDDFVLQWPGLGLDLELRDVRQSSGDVHAEILVTLCERELLWDGRFNLLSTRARDTLVKALLAREAKIDWCAILDRTCRQVVLGLRAGEPLVTLTGKVTSPTRELVPRLLYEGEPTLLYADGDTGKSLVALTLAVAVQSGVSLPCGLKPARAVPVAYLDWETSQDTVEGRLALIAAGLGIAPPPILYKRMTRPLVTEAAALAADFSRRGVGLVIIDSKMFAVAAGDGAAFHEPVTAFYTALRRFGRTAAFVLNHVTNADARTNGPARPFGGAFAFNGPRLIWEARRDQTIDDATAIAFVCKKANDLIPRPAPFGLEFTPSPHAITVASLNLSEIAPPALAHIGLALVHRVRLALAQGPRTVEALAEELEMKENSIRKTFQRYRGKGFVLVPNTNPQQWAKESNRG